MEINKKKNKYIVKCCEKGSKFKGKIYNIDIDLGNQKLKPYSFVIPFKNIVEDEDRIYIKPIETENSPSI
ncbi:MAG: hypothetical protein J6Q13_04150 [Clostridia bacterium]|nr:hypothetical protein [Clostridia bacterium]